MSRPDRYTATKPNPPSAIGTVLYQGCTVWEYCELSSAHWHSYGSAHPVSVQVVNGKWWRRSRAGLFGPYNSALSAKLGLTEAEVPHQPSALELLARDRVVVL